MNEQVFQFQTADERYESQMNSYLAQEPYAETSTYTTAGPQRASRPGGGTGVIPNPVPVGDGLLLLLSLALLLLLRRKGVNSRGSAERRAWGWR